MTQSMFKKLPDALSQISWPQVQQTLTQPFMLAIWASLGVHGLLALTLPLWSSTGKAELAAENKSVEVVTLNPLEQMRLPDNLTTQGLPSPLPNSGSTPFFQPLKPKTSAGKSVSPLLAAPPSINDASLYNIPVLPPPPVTVLPPLGLPPLPELNIPDTPRRRPAPVAASPSKLAEVLAKLSRQSGSAPASPSPSAPASPTVAAVPSPTEPVRPEKIPAAAIAALRERQEQLRQKNEGDELFAFNKANTTEGEFNQNITQLTEAAKEISQGNIDSEWNRQKEITDLYPKEACPSKAKGVTWVGAVFNPEGKLEKKPALLLSSGYAGLDQAALRYVEQQTFKSSEKYQAAIFPFKFEYSEAVCDTATPTSPDGEGSESGSGSSTPQ